MKAAYLDTSCLVAIAFGEPDARRVKRAMATYKVRFASNLLEAELKAALARENVAFEPGLLGELDWVQPERPLSPEIDRTLGEGYVRGADLWHLACALYVRPHVPGMAFVTLDRRQKEIAAALGFEVP